MGFSEHLLYVQLTFKGRLYLLKRGGRSPSVPKISTGLRTKNKSQRKE